MDEKIKIIAETLGLSPRWLYMNQDEVKVPVGAVAQIMQAYSDSEKAAFWHNFFHSTEICQCQVPVPTSNPFTKRCYACGLVLSY